MLTIKKNKIRENYKHFKRDPHPRKRYAESGGDIDENPTFEQVLKLIKHRKKFEQKPGINIIKQEESK